MISKCFISFTLCYGAGTTFYIYSHFRQQILTLQASTTRSVLLYSSTSSYTFSKGYDQSLGARIELRYSLSKAYVSNFLSKGFASIEQRVELLCAAH